MNARASLLTLPLLLVIAATGVARDKLCPKCTTTGRISNEIKRPKDAEREAAVLRCSWHISRDKKGRGLPFLPCKGCLAPSKAKQVQQEFDLLAAEVDQWMAGRLAIDKNLRPRDKLVHIETEHFIITYGLSKIVLPGKVVLNLHEGAHLYADRLEKFYTWFQQLLGYDDSQVKVKKHHVFLMADMRTLMKAATDYAKTVTDRSTRAVGDPSVFCTWRDKGVYPRDEDFHRHVLHNMSHQLLGVYYMTVWLVERAGWLEEGLGHVTEHRLFGVVGNSCNVEMTEEDMPDDDWEPLVKKMVLTGKAPSFAELRNKRADLLSGKEHFIAWSYTDFLLKRQPEAIGELIQRLKRDVDIRDVLRDLYDLTVVGIDEEWAAFVTETYRSKP